MEKRRDQRQVVAVQGGRTFSSSDSREMLHNRSKSAGDGGSSLLYSPTIGPRSLSSFNIMIVVIRVLHHQDNVRIVLPSRGRRGQRDGEERLLAAMLIISAGFHLRPSLPSSRLSAPPLISSPLSLSRSRAVLHSQMSRATRRAVPAHCGGYGRN